MLLANRIFFEQIEAEIAEGRSVRIRMKGHSMRPLLREGRDTVVLAPCGERDLRRGDIVLFRHAGRHVLHRILRCDGERFLLAGDGNYRIEERCRRSDIVARCTTVIRPSGRTVCCDSLRWRIQSGIWLSLAAPVRRVLLGAARHLGIG